MSTATKLKFLRIALVIVGLIFTVGLYLLMNSTLSEGWTWMPRQPEYEQMIMGVYATLGVFLFIAVKNPLEHRSLIWFTVWSSIVHATIMLVQALKDPTEHHNLMGDVPGLYIVALMLAIFMPSKKEVETQS